MLTIGIIQYGLGNIASVVGAVEYLGHTALVSSDPEALACADKLILPGVGAFGDGMRNLHQLRLVAPLTELVMERKRPLLGICLGSQLITRGSEEFGWTEGLGWVDADVRRLAPADPAQPVPHVGWNELHQARPDCPLFHDVPDQSLFYYVHSYHIVAEDPEVVAGTCDYGGRFTSVLHADNLYATQFHPEKSQRHGLKLLENFFQRC